MKFSSRPYCGIPLFGNIYIIRRTPLSNKENALIGSMRYIDWERGNPYVWQEKDTDELLSSPYLFARKFASASNVRALIRHIQ